MYTIDKIIKRFNSIFLKINNNHKPNDCINKKNNMIGVYIYAYIYYEERERIHINWTIKI